MDTPPTAYLSIPQLARRIGCGHSTLYADIRAGRFPFPLVRIGADLRVPLAAVERFESGEATDLAALRAEIAALAARVAAHEERERLAFAGLASAYAATPQAGAVPVHTDSVPPSLPSGTKLGEKARDYDSKHRPARRIHHQTGR